MLMNRNERDRLLTLLKTKSYRRGQVVLSSGKVSDFYVDCKQTSLSAEGALLCGRLLFQLILKNFPEARAVGGPTLGADPLVSAVATVSMIEGHPLDAFIIRKEPKDHGTAAWIEGMANLSEGHSVVLLEDVITTGGSTLRSIQHALEAKLKVLGVCVVLDRNEGGKEAIEAKGMPCLTLYNRSDFITP
jgi:orotate phosphoribosyltransferase